MLTLAQLLDTSSTTLQDLELQMRNLASQAEKRSKAEMMQAVRYLGIAESVRFLRDHRRELVDVPHQQALKFPGKEE